MLGFNAPASSAIADERFYRFPVPVSGVSADGLIGTVSIIAGAVISTTGVTAISSLGTVTARVSKSVTVSGVSATTQLGSVLVYGQIVPSPGTVWVDVDDTNDTSWSGITTPSGSWTDVVT